MGRVIAPSREDIRPNRTPHSGVTPVTPRETSMRITTLAVILATPLGVAVAQQNPVAMPESRADRFLRYCDENYDRDRENVCEVRDVTLKPSSRLFVDARENGSVRFWGWDKNEVMVRALITTSAEDKRDAQDMMKDIKVDASSDRVRADGPSRGRRYSWYVSYEVWMPRKSNLEAESSNGSMTVSGIEGRMDLRTSNGSITVRNVSGDVRGSTSNGSVNAELDGATWKGEGLDLTTSNGSVNLDIPRGYNARLETGTVNGGMNIDFPITIQGSISRRITTTLGSGGPRIRATTTNGGVRIRER